MSEQQDYSRVAQDVLHQYAFGRTQLALDALKPVATDILDHEGLGQIESYFNPAFYIEDFAELLIEAGFPIEKIYQRERDNANWISWPTVLDHMFKVAPHYVKDVISDGYFEEYGQALPLGTDPLDDDTDTGILWEYMPNALHSSLIAAATLISERTEEEWNAIYAAAHQQISAAPAVPKAATPRS